MRIAVGSDERLEVTDVVVAELERRGHEVRLFGPLAGDAETWPDVARQVAEEVATGRCDEGVLFCWTGTGVSIAANKVPGIRAALCADAETARGARIWNHANVLVMSLRLTTPAVAKEILDAWLSTPPAPEEAPSVAKVVEIERAYSGQAAASRA
jgi:ribose 5-phosphate isomerase B